MRFVSPKNDAAFKKIFGNEDKKEILISFLNSVLNLAGDKEIRDIEILNPWQAREYRKEGRKETATRMLSKGYAVSEVAKLTGLSADEIICLNYQLLSDEWVQFTTVGRPEINFRAISRSRLKAG